MVLLDQLPDASHGASMPVLGSSCSDHLRGLAARLLACSTRGVGDQVGDEHAVQRADAVAGTRAHLAPNRVATFEMLGVDLVMGRREGYRFWDLDGRPFLDLHLNGGTFNLGHRNPQVIAALTEALATVDIGNHHFASAARSELASRLVAVSPAGALASVVFTPSGSEAIDAAIRSARRATGRRRIVAFAGAFHGRSGLSSLAGDPANAAAFGSDQPDAFTTVAFDDLDALEASLASGDVAAVLAEVLPATSGFLIPSDDFYPAVRELCDRHGTMLVADEVQTGMGRTGSVWALDRWGVVPDALVTGKGLSGGIYPIAAVLLGDRMGAWLQEDGWGYVSTFGGSELGCVVGCTALDLSTSAEALAGARALAARYATGLAELAAHHPYLAEVRQQGLVMGLRFAERGGALRMCKALYDRGLWAMFAGFDTSVLQWKPGLLADDAFVDESLAILGDALVAVEAERAS